MAEDKSAGSELFELLNKDYVALNTENKERVSEILTADKDVLKSKEFVQPLSQDKEASERTLKTLKYLGDESTATDTLKHAADTVAKSVLAYREGTWQDPYQKQPEAQPQQAEQTDGAEKLKEADKPRGTLSVEQLREGAYRGTLTAEQQDQLKKHDEKNVADLKNLDGDRDHKKNEASKDKFKEEDVVKYMYEEWFLAGASWLFNKTEAFVLNSIDAAIDKATRRHQIKNTPKEPQDASNLTAAVAKASQFAQVTQRAMQNLPAHCEARKAGMKQHFADLTAYVNGEKTMADLKVYDTDEKRKVLKKLKADPEKAGKFIAGASRQYDASVELIKNTGKLSFLLTSLEMTDEMMRDDKQWRTKGKKDQPYLENEQLNQNLHTRATARQDKMLQAISVMMEDSRLYAEIAYDQAKDKPADKEKFIQDAVTADISSFLKKLEDRTVKIASKQASAVKDGNFDAVDKSPDKSIKKDIKETDKFIQDTIDQGKAFKKKAFENEASTERAKLNLTMLQAATVENTADNVISMEKGLSSVDGKLAEVQARQASNDNRKKSFEARKNKILKRDGQKNFDAKIAAMTAKQTARS